MVKLQHDFLLGTSHIQTTAVPLVPVPQTVTHPLLKAFKQMVRPCLAGTPRRKLRSRRVAAHV